MVKQNQLWSEKSIIVYAVLLMVIFFLVGANSTEGGFSGPLEGMNWDKSINFFFRICINNIMAGTVILLGSASCCIISFSIISYSSFTIGAAFMGFAKVHTLLNSFVLLVWHGAIEIIWLGLLILSAYEISNGLYGFLKDDQSKPNAIVSKRTYSRIILSFVLIVFGAFVEAFISLPLYLFIMNK